MKTNRLLSIASLMLCLVATVPIINGCAFFQKQSTQRATFNTVWSLASGVDTAYRGYLDLVIAGKLTTNSLPKVSAAYGTFQTSLNLAIVLVAGNTNAAPPQALLDSAASFNTTLTVAKGTK